MIGPFKYMLDKWWQALGQYSQTIFFVPLLNLKCKLSTFEDVEIGFIPS